MAKEQVKAESKEADHHIPTPPLGFPVYYIRDPGRNQQEMPGFVAAIEDVGKVSVWYILPNGHTQFQRGVHHYSDPDMQNRGPKSRNGAWRLNDSLPSPRGLFELSKERERKRAASLAALAEQQAVIARQQAGMKQLSDEKEPQGV